ncbi:MAG: hypothetical protein HYY05_05835 [Chloroflexi bacterium]|nr:hypothetical protein [Chloroflexota bacterium]
MYTRGRNERERLRAYYQGLTWRYVCSLRQGRLDEARPLQERRRRVWSALLRLSEMEVDTLPVLAGLVAPRITDFHRKYSGGEWPRAPSQDL